MNTHSPISSLSDKVVSGEVPAREIALNDVLYHVQDLDESALASVVVFVEALIEDKQKERYRKLVRHGIMQPDSEKFWDGTGYYKVYSSSGQIAFVFASSPEEALRLAKDDELFNETDEILEGHYFRKHLPLTFRV